MAAWLEFPLPNQDVSPVRPLATGSGLPLASPPFRQAGDSVPSCPWPYRRGVPAHRVGPEVVESHHPCRVSGQPVELDHPPHLYREHGLPSAALRVVCPIHGQRLQAVGGGNSPSYVIVQPEDSLPALASAVDRKYCKASQAYTLIG